MIRFEDVDESNWRHPLKVAQSQTKYVAGSTTLLARAYAYRHFRSRAFLICDDETPVGMGLYYDDPELGCYDLSQLFIDERYQGKGYGKEATAQILEILRQDGRYPKVVLCYIEGNDAARNLYHQFGFQETDRDEDEIVMELTL